LLSRIVVRNVCGEVSCSSMIWGKRETYEQAPLYRQPKTTKDNQEVLLLSLSPAEHLSKKSVRSPLHCNSQRINQAHRLADWRIHPGLGRTN
jgi:hypothetical protein